MLLTNYVQTFNDTALLFPERRWLQLDLCSWDQRCLSKAQRSWRLAREKWGLHKEVGSHTIKRWNFRNSLSPNSVESWNHGHGVGWRWLSKCERKLEWKEHYGVKRESVKRREKGENKDISSHSTSSTLTVSYWNLLSRRQTMRRILPGG